MRQMWGKNPPKDKGKNPYVDVPFEKRFEWCRKAFFILSDQSNKGRLKLNGTSIHIPTMQKDYMHIFSFEDLKLETNILSEHFGSGVNKFYDILFNPLSGLIAANIIAINKFCRSRNDLFRVVYDATHGSKGFHLVEAMNFCKKKNHLDRLLDIRDGECRSDELLQLADVTSYTLQRRRMEIESRTTDVGFRRLVEGIQPVFIPISEKHKNDLSPAALVSTLVLQYAFEYLRQIDPLWVNTYALSMEDTYKIGTELTSHVHLLNERAHKELIPK